MLWKEQGYVEPILRRSFLHYLSNVLFPKNTYNSNTVFLLMHIFYIHDVAIFTIYIFETVILPNIIQNSGLKFQYRHQSTILFRWNVKLWNIKTMQFTFTIKWCTECECFKRIFLIMKKTLKLRGMLAMIPSLCRGLAKH